MYNSSQKNQYYNGSSDNNRVDRWGGYANANPSYNRSNRESRSAAAGTWRTRTKDDDDDDSSLGSSVYSQPSVLGDGHSNLRRQNTTESRRQEPLYEDEQEFTNNFEPLEYPPSPHSPHAGSVTTRGSTAALTSGITQRPSYDQFEKNNDMMDQQYYRDFNQGPPEQFDVYNDFNNNLRSYNYDEEAASNPTNVALAGSNAYSKSNLSGKDFSDRDLPGGNGDEKGVRHSTTGDHLVVQQKRRRRCCCCCSRKLCVIITFIILVILGAGLFFVWPRIPSFSIQGDKTSPSTNNPTIRTDSPPIVDLDFTVTAMVDNRANWLPFYFKSINVQYFDPTNSRAIGSGVVKNFKISGRSLSSVDIPLSILYQPSQADAIVDNYATACTTPTNATQDHQTLLSATLNLQMFIFGLDWIYKPTSSIAVSDLKCPYE
ncbi:19955_t:CDS:2, partial [Dentiscutata erythropus]